MLRIAFTTKLEPEHMHQQYRQQYHSIEINYTNLLFPALYSLLGSPQVVAGLVCSCLGWQRKQKTRKCFINIIFPPTFTIYSTVFRERCTVFNFTFVHL